MGKKFGLVTFVAGLAAGAAALFLSDEDNRKLASKELSKAADKAKKLKEEYDEDPEGTMLDLAQKAEKQAKKVVKQVKKATATKAAVKKKTTKSKKK